MLFHRQDGEQIQGRAQQAEAQDAFKDFHPVARTRQDAGQLGPDAEQDVRQGHAQAHGPKDHHQDQQRLGEGPAQHTAQQRAAARRGQEGGDQTGQVGLQTGILAVGTGLEVDDRQGEDPQHGKAHEEDQHHQAQQQALLLIELPPDHVGGAQHQGQQGEQGHDACGEKEVVLTETPQALLVSPAAHEQQTADFEGQYRKDAGHGIEQQARQNAHGKRHAESRDLHRAVSILRRQLQGKTVRGRQGLFAVFLLQGGQRVLRRIRNGTQAARSALVHGKRQTGHRGAAFGEHGRQTPQFFPAGLPGGLFQSGQGIRYLAADGLRDRKTIARGTEQHAQDSLKAAMPGLVRQKDEQGRGAFVNVDGRIRIEQIPLHEALRIPDGQSAAVIQTDGKRGRASGISGFMGIGMVALRECHLHSHNDAVRAFSKMRLHGYDVRRSGLSRIYLKYKQK